MGTASNEFTPTIHQGRPFPRAWTTAAATVFGFVTMNFYQNGPCAGLKDEAATTRVAALIFGVAVLFFGILSIVRISRIRTSRVVYSAILALPFVLWNLLLCWMIGLPSV